MRVTVVPMTVGAFGTVPKVSEKTGRIGNKFIFIIEVLLSQII